MDGFFQGKSHLEMDDLGVPPFQETPKYAPGIVDIPSLPWLMWAGDLHLKGYYWQLDHLR